MPECPIVLEGVTKAYGDTVAIRDLSLRVQKGAVYGFLGRNGAGKTTTVRMLMGLLRQDRGATQVLGEDPWLTPVETKQRIAYVSENQTLFEWMSVERVIKFNSKFYPRWNWDTCARLLKRFELDPQQRIGAMSKGQARKVALLLAICQEPDLLILDEPASGVDTLGRREFLDSLAGMLREQERTVFYGSHILPDIDRIADHVGIIDGGRLILSKPLAELKASVKRLRMARVVPEERVSNHFDVLRSESKDGELRVTVSDFSSDRQQELASSIAAEVVVEDLSLEDIFVDVLHREREHQGSEAQHVQ